MLRPTLLIAVAALALAGPVMANSTKPDHAKHTGQARTAVMHSDERIIDRCAAMHYGEKVACLRQARGGYTDQWNSAGATSGASASGMTGGAAPGSVRTPAQPNETQPGLSGTNRKPM
jgi:hypothetical protein